MKDYQTLMAATRVCISRSDGNVYVYISDGVGKTACHTIVGDVVVVRGKLEVVARVDTVEYGVSFPGDE